MEPQNVGLYTLGERGGGLKKYTVCTLMKMLTFLDDTNKHTVQKSIKISRLTMDPLVNVLLAVDKTHTVPQTSKSIEHTRNIWKECLFLR